MNRVAFDLKNFDQVLHVKSVEDHNTVVTVSATWQPLHLVAFAGQRSRSENQKGQISILCFIGVCKYL